MGAFVCSLGSDPFSLGGVDGAVGVDGNGWHFEVSRSKSSEIRNSSAVLARSARRSGELLVCLALRCPSFRLRVQDRLSPRIRK